MKKQFQLIYVIGWWFLDVERRIWRIQNIGVCVFFGNMIGAVCFFAFSKVQHGAS